MPTNASIIDITLASAVATNGTFDVAYPTGFGKGNYALGKNHKFVAQGALFNAPKDFTVSFGATAATITYLGATTLAAGAAVKVQLDIQGEDQPPLFQRLPTGAVEQLHSFLLNLGSPKLAVTTAFINGATSTELPNATTIAYTSATYGTSPVDGTYSATFKPDVPRNLTLTVTHGSSIVAMEARVEGTDWFDREVYEVLAVTATGTSKTATGVKTFKTITSVTFYSAGDATANTASLGFGSKIGLPVHVGSVTNVIGVIENGVAIDGGLLAPISIPFDLDTVDLLAGTVNAVEIIAPCDGVLLSATSIVRKAITTGGDVTVDVRGGTTVSGSTMTFANSATKGTSNTATFNVGHASTVVSKGDRIQIIGADAFAGNGAVNGVLLIQPTGLVLGTLQVGLSPLTTPTSTTNDPLGMYTPYTTLDGTVPIALQVQVADPSFLGSQYTT